MDTHKSIFGYFWEFFLLFSFSVFLIYNVHVIYTLTAVVGDGERVDEGGEMVGG